MDSTENVFTIIVEYSAGKTAYSDYPRFIVSPTHADTCCESHMQAIGELHWEDREPFTYKQCEVCGYTVRHFLSDGLESSEEGSRAA